MFHTAAYITTLLAQAANFDTPALSDDILAISNNHFLPQRDYDLVAAYVQSTTLNRARLVSPTNRQITLPFIRPTSANTTPPSRVPLADYRDNPFRVEGLEELALEMSSDLGAATEVGLGVVFLETGRRPAPRGQVFTLRGTSTTTAAVNLWTTLAMTWADALPVGRYAIVGMEVIGATEIAGRVILEGQYERPGCIAGVLVGGITHPMFQKGGLGLWGEFVSTRMPIVQVLNLAAVAVHTVYLDIIKIS